MKIFYLRCALSVLISSIFLLSGCASVNEPENAGVLGGTLGGVAGVLPSAIGQGNTAKSGTTTTSGTKSSSGKSPAGNPVGK